MARLIDADALMRTHESEVATIRKDWTIDDLTTAIETAPTIDAIPVEWLRNHRELPLPRQNIYSIIYMWQKEQEAQD